MDERYEAPSLIVIGEIAQLTAGSESGVPDQNDGAGSQLGGGGSDVRLKRDIRPL